MREIILQHHNIHLGTFDQQVREVFGEAVSGVSYDGETVTIHFLTDGITEAQRVQALNLMAAHDASRAEEPPTPSVEEQLAQLQAEMQRLQQALDSLQPTREG
jgi:hypothetical protein